MNKKLINLKQMKYTFFLPIDFAQLWLQKEKWHEECNEILPNKKEVSKRYDETLSFQIIIEIVKDYFENKPCKIL